jgi:hypothetical protein
MSIHRSEHDRQNRTLVVTCLVAASLLLSAVAAVRADDSGRAATTDPDNATVSITVTPDGNNPDPGNQVGAARKRDVCTVDVRVSLSEVSLVTGKFLDGVPLRASCSMRHE